MGARLVRPHADHDMASVAGHIRALQAAGKDVVFVTSTQPCLTLHETFQSHGVDADAIFYIDTVTASSTGPRPENAAMVPSPTMLELIAMRVEQVARRRDKPPHVVVCRLDTLTIYNTVPVVRQFFSYLNNRVTNAGHDIDWIVGASPDELPVEAFGHDEANVMALAAG